MRELALEPVGRAPGARECGELGLDPALPLDEVTAGVAGVHVLPGPLGLGRGELAVEEGRHARAEVADHETASGAPSGPAYRSRPDVGARCASAARSIDRPRWMRERTVPSLASRMVAISS